MTLFCVLSSPSKVCQTHDQILSCLNAMEFNVLLVINRSVLCFFLLCCLMCSRVVVAAAAVFLPEQQVLPQLDSLQQKAVTEHKLLLVVLGAQWCHDSEALLQNFHQPKFSAALASRYVMAFVDVGYLQFGQVTAQRYQLPLYYGTPTVMIIDPQSGQLLNKSSLMRWTSAASLSWQDFRRYFIETDFKQQFSLEQQQLAGVRTELLQQIAAFEQQQAIRLTKAYAHIGPLLQAYKDSGKPASDEFKQSWEEVKNVRSQLLSDVLQLQQQAKALAPAQQLQMPKYAAFRFVKE